MTHIASRRQFLRNLTSGWMLLVVEVVVAFLLTPYIIAKLGAAQYGVWALMISVIGYMGLIDVGLRGSVGRYVNHYLALKDARGVSQVVGTASVVLTGASIAALLVSFVMAAFFESLFPKTPHELLGAIRFCLPLLAVGLWLSFVSSILGNLLAAREAMYLTNHYTLVITLLRAGAIVWALSRGYGIEALVLITLGASVTGVLISWRALRRMFGAEMPSVVAFNMERLSEMWRFGLASFASRTSSTMANDSAPLIGMWLLGPEAVGVYSVAMTLTQYSRRLIDQAGSAIFPSVMKAGAIRDYDGLRSVYLRFMDLSFGIGSLVFIGMIVFSHSFLGLWVGPTYQEGAVVVAILAFGYLMQGVASTAQLTLASLDRVNLTMKIGIAEAIGCVVLTAALPGLFGLGLAGMALGATLPRLVTSCAVYPALVVSLLGEPLRASMARAIRSNLLLSAGVSAAFTLVWFVLPGHTWPTLVAACSLITLLHVVLLGSRYEILGVGRAKAALRSWAQRLRRPT